MILAGEMSPGTKLPSMHELAKELDTSYFTVQSALTPLVEEGLIERRRRRGSFVCSPPTQLTSVGIVFGSDIWAGSGNDFYRTVYIALQQKLTERGMRWRVWFEPVGPRGDKDVEAEIVDLAGQRQLQCLIAPLCNRSMLAWLGRLGMPFAAITSREVPGRVDFDAGLLARLFVAQLAASGCESVGLITVDRKPVSASTTEEHAVLLHAEFERAAATAGLTYRSEWCITPARHPHDLERFGYDAFKKLWSRNRRPEGMAVFPDIAARGVVAGMLELSVRAPDDIATVFHKNEGVELFSPFLATYVVSSPRQASDALIAQAARLVAGEKTETTLLPYYVANS
jgi:DNA-binding LacI/PurR family transcriptional regulator